MNNREREIWTSGHMDFGYSKLSSEHLAFEKGAKWADSHPSDELIKNILIVCNKIKNDEKSEFAPLDDCPYEYMIDELVISIKNKIQNE